MQERLHITCDCGSSEHQFTLIKDTEDDEIWLETHLITYRNFFKRLWVGLKYAFGYKSKYGNFDSILLTKEDCKKISKFVKTNSNKK